MTEELVGRTRELGDLTDFVRTSRKESRAILLEGPPGVGKSALWRAAIEAARETHVVLRARPDSAEALGEGLVGLASIDHPEHVETLAGSHDIALLGGWSGIREAAMANLARLRADDVVPLGDDTQSQVHLSVGGFFNASRVFTMNQLLREDFLIELPAHGVLFVVPNRHLVAVHPISGIGMVHATTTLIRVAQGEYDVPGSISPHVWFWRDGEVQQVTRPAEESTVELHVEGMLEQVMREVGLIEDDS